MEKNQEMEGGGGGEGKAMKKNQDVSQTNTKYPQGISLYITNMDYLKLKKKITSLLIMYKPSSCHCSLKHEVVLHRIRSYKEFRDNLGYERVV